MAMWRVCSKCGDSRPETRFAWTDASHRARRKICKDCENTRNADRYARQKRGELAPTKAREICATDKIRVYAASKNEQWFSTDDVCRELHLTHTKQSVRDLCRRLCGRGELESQVVTRPGYRTQYMLLFRLPQVHPCVHAGPEWGWCHFQRVA